MADNLVRNFESLRPGTDKFFHSLIGYGPHRLDQAVRRLRLRLLPNHAFGKVAFFWRVPSDSISLRNCTAKGECLVIV